MSKQDVMIDDAECYRSKGYVLKRGLFSAAEAQHFKQVCKQDVGEGVSPSGVEVFKVADLSDAMRSIVCDSRIVSTLRDIVGQHIEFLSVKPVYKSAVVSFASPWHQDWQYWGGAPKVSVWIALDAATIANGCLRFVPGSHLRPWGHEKAEDGHGFANRISEESLAGQNIVDAVMNAGDALFFHDLLLHASHPNTSGRDRWSMIPTYRDADVKDTGGQPIWSESIRL